MSKAWPLVKLGEVLRKSQNWIKLDPQQEYNEVTVRLWGKGVTLRGIVTGSQLAGNRRLQVHTNQFILSRIDARNGAFGLIPDELEGAIVSNDFPVFEIDRDKLSPEYLHWLSKTKNFVESCKTVSEGTTNRVRLKEEKFIQIKVPLPPLAEQQRIVAKIERLARKIEEAKELRQQARNKLERLWKDSATIIFNEAVIKHPHKPLQELVDIRGGGTPSKSNPTYWEGSIPWITPKDMKIRNIYDAIDHISESATRETSAKIIDEKAVIIVVRGMILVHTFPSAVLKVAAAINQDMKALIPNKNLLPEFLCSFFWVFNLKIIALVEKSTHDTRKLRTEKLLDIEVPIPSPSEQRTILTKIDNLCAKIDRLKTIQDQTTTELNAILPSILDKAFKGEL